MKRIILVRESDLRDLLESIWDDCISIGGLEHDAWVAAEMQRLTVDTIDEGE